MKIEDIKADLHEQTGKKSLEGLMTALATVTNKHEFLVLKNDKEFEIQRGFLFENYPELYKDFIHELDMLCVEYNPLDLVD